MNSINLMGRLTAAVELKVTQSGIEVATFMIAINRPVAKDKEKIADFIPCVAWGKTALFASTYFGKGDMIAIEGSLQSRKYADKDGKNHTAYEVRVNQIHFCGGKQTVEKAEKGDIEPQKDVQKWETVSEDDDLPFG